MFGLVASACTGSAASSSSAIPAQDLVTHGATFNRDEIVPGPAFTDFGALATSDVQTFLEHTPYAGSSFLATYQSNGILFPAAVTVAAQTYRINPIVLLVAVEAYGQLVADGAYPQPSSRVDYLFGCGCSIASDAGSCDPAAAGLDVQLSCYANALRTSLDAITETGATPGGWAPGQSATTLDGVQVTPVDGSTASLYQYDPLVGDGQSGNSLFWSIWNEYVLALAYSAPEGSSSGGTAQIGDACITSADCATANAICQTGSSYPGGMCTSQCTGSCPGVDTFCGATTVGGLCLSICNPTDPASCRTGYPCALVQPSGAPSSTPSATVCAPG
jgi:hypothetical protein